MSVFIRPSVIQRLKDGTFVSQRKSKPGSLLVDERRDTVSPLSIVKRCVKYDAKVFDNRLALLVELAQALNEPDRKLVMVGGQQGNGKTSLVRGLIELMGGGQEQVLWFDMHRHTQPEEIVHFFIEYIQYICTAIHQYKPNFNTQDPIEKLESLILQIENAPLLVVIDNVEYLIGEENKIQFHPLKEILNFILSFANIKLVLVGEALPTGDMGTENKMVKTFWLKGLPESAQTKIVQSVEEKIGDTVPSEIFLQTEGNPWLLRVLMFLGRTVEDPAEAYRRLTRLLGHPKMTSQTVIMRFIYQQLSSEEKEIAHLMAFLRHPIDVDTALSMIQFCHDKLLQKPDDMEAVFEDSFLRPVLKRTFPPQEVLEHVQHRHQSAKTFQPWYELYREFKKVIYQDLPVIERNRMHERLEQYYTAERNDLTRHRLYWFQPDVLLEESLHHQQASRKRRTQREISDTEKTVMTDNPNLPSVLLEPLEIESPSYFHQHDILTPTQPDALFEEKVDLDEGEELSLQLSDEEKMLLMTTPIIESDPDQKILEVLNQDVPAVFSEENEVPMGEADLIEKSMQTELIRSVSQGDRKAFAKQMLLLAEHRFNKRYFALSEECLEKVKTIESELSLDLSFQFYRLKGKVSQETYRHYQAVEFFQKALEIAESLPEKSEALWGDIGKIQMDLADIKVFQEELDIALEGFMTAIKTFKQYPQGYFLSEAYFKAASVLDELNRLEEALFYYEQSLVLDQQANRDLSCAATCSNMGTLYLDLNQWSSAIEKFNQALLYDSRADNSEGIFKTYELLGFTYLEQSNLENAQLIYEKALKLAQTENQLTWEAKVYLKLGDIESYQKQWESALLLYEKAKYSAPDDLSQESIQWIEHKIKETHNALRYSES